ncbi:hypothetical protein Salat_0231100 [Sesamum alatum]|uniref:Transposase Tnp1/En/Spm-like domain-containing protein n=1 Tax=Sesamum alatum TaxID=300844 RepID=A0AAE2CYD2_9LAMI|nr:hypothetical protein Salat_0231100 [Sesamum alatum]
MPYAQKMEIDRIHQQTFHTWFKNQVEKLSLANNGLVNEDLKRLARGPKDMAKRLKGFVINGVKFHTKSYELNRRTQTSGVMVNAKTLSYASSKDKNPIEGVVTYYGSTSTSRTRGPTLGLKTWKRADWRAVSSNLKELMWSEIEKSSEMARANRSQLKMSHTTGRKSYARIRADETMKSGGLVPSCAEIFHSTICYELDQSESSQRVASRNDSLSKVLGEDRHGYVRTFGLGPSPSDIFGPQPTRMEYKRIAEQAIRSSDERVHAMEERMLGMQKKIEEMAMQMRSMRMAMENMPGGRSDTTRRVDCTVAFSPIFSQAARVDLLNFKTPEEVVAQGRVISKDLSQEVGGFKLGPDFWEVYIEVAIKEQEFLIRPRGQFSTIKEVVGSTIAWPSTKVIPLVQHWYFRID